MVTLIITIGTMIKEVGKLGTAIFSDCRRYRYLLERPLLTSGDLKLAKNINFIMLNPSIATADTNDPTVAKCCQYAMASGGTHLTVINIFAWRSTDPDELKLSEDPIGPDNNQIIIDTVKNSYMTICGWGNHGKLLNRGPSLVNMLLEMNLDRLFSLKINTKGGMSPGHPLYLSLALKPQRWTEARTYGQCE